LIVEQTEWEAGQGTLTIAGIVRNAGQEAATDIQVTVTSYTDEGAVASVRQMAVEPLDPGEQKTFSMSLIPAAPVARIEAVAWGLTL
jgi:hypothetical protein